MCILIPTSKLLSQCRPYRKALFAELVDQEDPDLLDWFMEVGEAPRTEIKELIVKLKQYVHG